MRRLILIVVAAFLVSSACADPSPDASARLSERVARIRAAVESGDVDRARTLLDRLRSAVDRFVRNDALSGEQAGQIVVAADELDTTLILLEPAEAPSPSPSPEPPPEEPEEDEDDEGRGNGNGNGNGRGNGNGNGKGKGNDGD